MRTSALAISSFLLGVAVTVAVFRLFVSPPETNAQIDNSFAVPRVSHLDIAIPVVPPLRRILMSNSLDEGGGSPTFFLLDGLTVDRMTFENPSGVTFEYGGGAFSLSNSVVKGPVDFAFVGAAANTYALLDSLGVIAHSPISQPNLAALPDSKNVNTPKHAKTKLAQPLHGNISSQYERFPSQQ